MNKFKRAAIIVLKENKSPLDYKVITSIAIEKGYLDTEGLTPALTMNSQLSREIKELGKASDFVKESTGVYGINKNKVLPTFAQIETLNEQDEEIKVKGTYIGKGGEHLVCAELLFREYNASIMSVDDGMDVYATKGHKLFAIQVKTANINQHKYFTFTVNKNTFDKSFLGRVFYVFVLKNKSITDFVIFSQQVMDDLIKGNAIKKTANGNKYIVQFGNNNGEFYIGKKQNKVSKFLNKWELIK
jgi:hypothetical protein